MKKHVEKVIELNERAEIVGGMKLRAELVNEECRELVRAMGFDIDKRGVVVSTGRDRLDNASIVKECCDCHVVVSGVMHELGLTAADADVCQDIVDDNNLLKIETSPGRGPSGKLLKADDHPKCEPVIQEYLDAIGEVDEVDEEIKAGDYDVADLHPTDVAE
jgi:hypothetical protein